MKNQTIELLSKEQSEAFYERLKSFTDIVAQTKAAKPEDTGTFKVIISTDSMDRGGDVVMQESLDFGNYMKNPVVLWGHDYYSLPIGITDSITREGNKTICVGRFANTPEAQKVRAYYDAGFPLGASIGYILHDREGEKLTDVEMLEFSFCSVPMNQDCVPLREARLKNLDIAFLSTKGIKFVEILEKKVEKKEEKEAEEGDACTIDGEDGILGEDDNGNLVCMPKEKSVKKSDVTNPDKDELDTQLRDDLKAEHAMHHDMAKAILEKCWKAIDEAKSIAGFQEKGISEYTEKCYKEIKAEHKRHEKSNTEMIDEYMEKMTTVSANDDPTKTNKLGQEAVEQITKSVNALEIILKGVKSSEEPVKPAEQKVEPKGIDLDGVDNVHALRGVLKGLATSIGETLEVINSEKKTKR